MSDRLNAAIEAAQRWAIFDPDPVTRSAIDRLVDVQSPRLMPMFEGRIAFGTAGLRAPVGPGPNGLNALVVRQTAAAVAQWLGHRHSDRVPLVLVGYDARATSASFARHAASALIAGGVEVQLADQWLPTPVVAHALIECDASAAIVITASHNPAPDNGFKLYLDDGIQLGSPVDLEIALLIDELASTWHEMGVTIDDTWPTVRPSEVADDWLRAHRLAAAGACYTQHRAVRVAYTAMHGVAGQPVMQAFETAGFAAPAVAAVQFEPDPLFPTVSFPNPEEPGALDQLVAVAESVGADMAIANDPDGDRMAMAVLNRAKTSWVNLSGNDLGVLIGDHVLRHTTGDDRLVARSVVSTRLLDKLADDHGIACEVTLTGFKWVARPIVDRADKRFVFGFEEALGYCIGTHVRDKDGITAAVVAAELVAELVAHGRTVWDRLDEIALRHGVHLTRPVTAWVRDPAVALEAVARLLADPPTEIAGVELARIGPIGFGELPATSGVQLLAVDGTQVIVRPSGTEPKLKAYLEVVEGLRSADDLVGARGVAVSRLDAVEAWLNERLSR